MSSKNLYTLPVYQKAQSLYELSSHLVSYFSFDKKAKCLYESNSLRDNITSSLLTDSRLISKSITEALGSKTYRTQRENTTLIAIMIRNISSYCKGLENEGVKEKDYLNLLRNEINGFKTSFKNWSSSLPNLD